MLVTLLGDVAVNYVQMRVFEQQIAWVGENVRLQKEALETAQAKLDAGLTGDLDTQQGQGNLAQTEAQLPLLEIGRRQAANRLCVLLGMPPTALQERVGSGSIPQARTDLTVLMPASLLARRPDVRRAERLVAAQAEQVGIAEADLYPAMTISGDLGYSASRFADLFSSRAFNGSVGPSFQWNLLNYGRILGNIRWQDVRLQELVVAYQQTVLLAAEEVENGLVSYLRSQQRVQSLQTSVNALQQAAETVLKLYDEGAADFNRVALIQQDLVQRRDALAQAQGQVAQGLIEVYRGLGGGWELQYGIPAAPSPAPKRGPQSATKSIPRLRPTPWFRCRRLAPGRRDPACAPVWHA